MTIDGNRLVPGELDTSEVINFLDRCQGMSTLRLLNCSPSTDFYERLPNILPAASIIILEIRQSEAVEFELVKFQNLKTFELTGSHLSPQMVNQTFQLGKVFGKLFFRYFRKNSDLTIWLTKCYFYGKSFMFNLVMKDNRFKKQVFVSDYSQAMDYLREHEQANDCILW